MRPILSRTINVPGFEQLPDITNTELDGYIKDGFWNLRLRSILEEYTQDDGTGLTPPLAEDAIYLVSNEGPLPEDLQRMVCLSGGFIMLRLKVLNLAINFTAKAGPVEFEQQASATTLRAILASLERELQELEELYSDELGKAGLHYWDGEAQAAASMLAGLPALTVAT
jgi:hypothetical protein